ncbi:hypothetical protein ONR57_12715 [Hoyosella sp. YIM 151337]|uniref:hypothetical protein n=1 Tax=Hoyosella sp. YIM 151337 TaxID=2992742 RepID=UPI002235B724|nr:hypothetical protein [Hoyosella sp. YIM 151337]MCW4354163.1 hypothetical protein [Hoyosella sp. YIM 151337]
MSGYLLIIADREPLGWILSERRTAFPHKRATEARSLRPGDSLFLYTTRGCYRNPGRDRGRIIAEAHVATTVAELDEPVRFGDHEYPVGCDLSIEKITPFGSGPELAHLVGDLQTFAPMGGAWSIKLRRALTPLTDSDCQTIRQHLAPLTEPVDGVIQPYLRWWSKR